MRAVVLGSLVRRLCKSGEDMAVEERNGFWWGTDSADACAFLERHLGQGQWAYMHSPLKEFAGEGKWISPPSTVTCDCASDVCRLEVDDTDRICRSVCATCDTARRFIPDKKECCVGREWMFFSECECGSNLLNIASGVFQAPEHRTPLILVSLRCANCGHLECFAVRESPLGCDAIWEAL
jgi:hypothetical protein